MHTFDFLLAEPAKQTTFQTEAEFIAFAVMIRDENEDSELPITTTQEAEQYIKTYCPNLEII